MISISPLEFSDRLLNFFCVDKTVGGTEMSTRIRGTQALIMKVAHSRILSQPTQSPKLSFSDTFDPSDWPSKPVPRNTNSNSNSKFDSSKFETKFNSHVMENDQPSSNGSKSGLSGALKSGLTKNSTFASFNSVGSMKTNSSVESIWSNNNSSSVSICSNISLSMRSKIFR